LTEAVIASHARTPIGKAYRGSLNATHGATLGAHAVAAAVKRAELDLGEVQDVIVGASIGEGSTRARSRCARGFPSRRPARRSTGSARAACRRSRSPLNA